MRDDRKRVAEGNESLKQVTPARQSGIRPRCAIAETVGEFNLVDCHLQNVFIWTRDWNFPEHSADARGIAIGHCARTRAAAKQRLDDDAGMTAGTEHDQAHGSSASLAA